MLPPSPATGRRVGSRGPAGLAAVVFLAATLAGMPATVGAAGETRSDLWSEPGAHVASFELPSGTVFVNLPGDLAAGETFSAVVNPIPWDDDAWEEQARELETFTVEVAGTRAGAGEKIRTFPIPPGATALTVRLLDSRGRVVGEVEAPLSAGGAPPADYRIPGVGQAGTPLQVQGDFDGDLANSSVRLGGQEAELIGESRRQLVVRGPEETLGAVPVEVSEGGVVVATGQHRNVDVQLAAGATTLRSGQKTTLTIRVTGVEGLKETLPLQLTNATPAVVQVERGDQQTLCIRPDDVGRDGSWTAERGLTGVKAGGFGVTAVVQEPGPRAETWAAITGEMQEELRVRLLLERSAASADGGPLAAGTYGVIVRGAGAGGKVRLDLVQRGEVVGELAGGVLQRMPSTTPCGLKDAAGQAQQLQAGTGRPAFSGLGFEDDEPFEVRSADAQGGRRLVLETEEQDFLIEADLGARHP